MARVQSDLKCFHEESHEAEPPWVRQNMIFNWELYVKARLMLKLNVKLAEGHLMKAVCIYAQ